MTHMQMLLLLAHQLNSDPEEQQKQKEKKSDEDFSKKLEEAQERSVNRTRNIKEKDQLVKESQEKMLKMIKTKES